MKEGVIVYEGYRKSISVRNCVRRAMDQGTLV